MGELVQFVGHKYEFIKNFHPPYQEVIKNGKKIGLVSNRIPGIKGWTLGFEHDGCGLEVDGAFVFYQPEGLKGFRTRKEAVRKLELEILHATEDKDNIGTTGNWEDYYTSE